MADTELEHECGHTSQPIRMQFPDFHALSCDIQTLVNHWHDRSGFHRGLAQVSVSFCLSVDRALDSDSSPLPHKCNQMLILSDGWLQMPVHPIEGDTQWHWYRLVAVSFHIGPCIATGHYRTAIFSEFRWFIYDDNQLPEIISTLPDEICSQIVLMWFVRADRINDATAAPASSSRARPAPYAGRRCVLSRHHGPLPGHNFGIGHKKKPPQCSGFGREKMPGHKKPPR